MKLAPTTQNSTKTGIVCILAGLTFLLSKRTVRVSFFGMAFLLLPSCMMPQARYQVGTKSMPVDRVAVLVNIKTGETPGFLPIGDIDGIGKGAGLVSEYHLLPGRHVATCNAVYNGDAIGYARLFLTGQPYSASFVAEGGHKYNAKISTDCVRPTLEIRDTETNKLVSSPCATPDRHGYSWE